ncbi:hypothetical protein AB0758_44070 [Tolypothrix bouteillei VB521301_2]|uniref:hypothetical protein n=1 Tax=Tolypothrix bouteillei TaxID=1246981 RepID=UPI000AB3B983
MLSASVTATLSFKKRQTIPLSHSVFERIDCDRIQSASTENCTLKEKFAVFKA